MSDRDNEVVLEVNTLPGMTPTSLLPKMGHGGGISFDDLVEEMLGAPACGPTDTGGTAAASGHLRGPRTAGRVSEGFVLNSAH